MNNENFLTLDKRIFIFHFGNRKIKKAFKKK